MVQIVLPENLKSKSKITLPDEDEEESILSFIESYDTCDNVYEYEEWQFPYNFSYVRSDNA